jgi:hypothetical protein
MWMWILSSMDLFAKLALGGIFWSIAICIVVAVIGGIVLGVQKMMEG